MGGTGVLFLGLHAGEALADAGRILQAFQEFPPVFGRGLFGASLPRRRIVGKGFQKVLPKRLDVFQGFPIQRRFRRAGVTFISDVLEQGVHLPPIGFPIGSDEPFRPRVRRRRPPPGALQPHLGRLGGQFPDVAVQGRRRSALRNFIVLVKPAEPVFSRFESAGAVVGRLSHPFQNHGDDVLLSFQKGSFRHRSRLEGRSGGGEEKSDEEGFNHWRILLLPAMNEQSIVEPQGYSRPKSSAGLGDESAVPERLRVRAVHYVFFLEE